MKRTLGLDNRVRIAALAAGLAAVAAAAYLVRRRRRTVQLFRSVTVGAPPEAVYDFWSRFENFPECFSHVKDVRRTGNDNEWRWSMESPSGAVEWDAWVTESIPGKAIAWESAPGSKVRSAGVVQFTEAGTNSTRVDLRLFYRPSGRRAANTLKSALGTNPGAELAEGMARLQAKFDEDLPSAGDGL